jgi:RNA polymerase sigma factor (sigma-70 family)
MVMVSHDVMNRRRKRSRREAGHALLSVVATEPHESSEALLERAEELARVNGCILRMAELQRRVVTLSLLDEHPREHVATTLGISDAYLRVLLHRAREHLRSCTFEYDDEKEG